MKNLYYRSLAQSFRLCRLCAHPAKMLLAQVAVSPGRFQILWCQNSSVAKDLGNWRKAHSLFALTCLIVIMSFVIWSGEGPSLGYRVGHFMSSDQNLLSVSDSSMTAERSSSRILVSSAEELIRELKQENLWDIETLDHPTNVMVSRFPADLGTVTLPDKKKAFIVSVLPAAMVVLEEVQEERQELLAILDQLGGNPAELIFSKAHPGWMESLGANSVAFVETITKKYRTENATELLKRVNVLPLSLIVAQGAIESSWGSSRFATEANNLFGMWTWGQRGILPARRDAGKTHRIALYDSILESVRAYVLTINRVSAYDDLRQIRQETLDPYLLSEGLLHYSERKERYVEDVKRVIEANNLEGYDRISISAT